MEKLEHDNLGVIAAQIPLSERGGKDKNDVNWLHFLAFPLHVNWVSEVLQISHKKPSMSESRLDWTTSPRRLVLKCFLKMAKGWLASLSCDNNFL